MKRKVIRIRTVDSLNSWRTFEKPKAGKSKDSLTLEAADAIATARKTADSIRAFNAVKNAYFKDRAAL